MFGLVLSLITAPSAAIPALPDTVAGGYYALHIIIDDSPAQIGLRLTWTDGALLADVYPAMGGGPVRAREAKLEGASLRLVAVVHDGFELALRLTFDGESVKGTWSTGAEQGLISGRRAPDPHGS